MLLLIFLDCCRWLAWFWSLFGLFVSEMLCFMRNGSAKGWRGNPHGYAETGRLCNIRHISSVSFDSPYLHQFDRRSNPNSHIILRVPLSDPLSKSAIIAGLFSLERQSDKDNENSLYSYKSAFREFIP